MPKNTAIMDCFTCGAIEAYSQQANDFAGNLSSALQGPMSAIFLSLAGLWVVWSGYKLIFAKIDLVEIGKEFIYIILASVLLSVQGPRLISSIYHAALSIMGSAAETMFRAAGGSITGGKYTGVVALASQAEASVVKIFDVVMLIIGSSSLLNIMNILFALFLGFPYILLIITFSAQVVVSIFRVMMIATFAPFLFLAFAFGWSRSIAIRGVNTLLATAMVLFASTAALAVGLYGVDHLLADTSGMTASQVYEYASLSNPTFLAAMFLGWLGLAFQAEGTSIANSIAGSQLTNSTAAHITKAVSAVTIGGAWLFLKKGGRLGLGLGKFGLRKFGESSAGQSLKSGIRNLPGTLSDGAKSLLNRFKEVFNPPPSGDGSGGTSSPPPPPPSAGGNAP